MMDRSSSGRGSMTELRRLSACKTHRSVPTPSLGAEMVQFFHQSVQKRQTRLGEIAERWGALVPELISEHCSLEGLHRGTLTVIVDNSAHLFELKQLLLSGLQKQLLLACRKSGLRKITLKQGRWYSQSEDGLRQAKF